MRFRKLRIAWSVVWGLSAVLLIALWVRSYWRHDSVQFPISKTDLVGAWSIHGTIAAYRGTYQPGFFNKFNRFFYYGDVNPKTIANRPQLRSGYHGPLGSGLMDGATPRSIPYAPHWFVALVAAVTGSLPWALKIRRFSLRTLLIATTLIAVVLGLAAYAASK